MPGINRMVSSPSSRYQQNCFKSDKGMGTFKTIAIKVGESYCYSGKYNFHVCATFTSISNYPINTVLLWLLFVDMIDYMSLLYSV